MYRVIEAILLMTRYSVRFNNNKKNYYLPVVKHRTTKYIQSRDLVEELSVVKVKENTELVTERLLKLTLYRYVHLERHRGQAPVAVCGH